MQNSFVSGLEDAELCFVVRYVTADILGHILVSIYLNKLTLSEDGKKCNSWKIAESFWTSSSRTLSNIKDYSLGLFPVLTKQILILEALLKSMSWLLVQHSKTFVRKLGVFPPLMLAQERGFCRQSCKIEIMFNNISRQLCGLFDI